MTTAGGAAGAAAADGEETVLLATPAHLNVNKLSRLLRREDVSAFNCLASIEADAAWVAGVSRAHAHLPVVANLRCGRWYVEAPDAECYFKVRRKQGGARCGRPARDKDESLVTW